METINRTHKIKTIKKKNFRDGEKYRSKCKIEIFLQNYQKSFE